MLLQIEVPTEPLVTESTGVRFGFGMSVHVKGQIVQLKHVLYSCTYFMSGCFLYVKYLNVVYMFHVSN